MSGQSTPPLVTIDMNSRVRGTQEVHLVARTDRGGFGAILCGADRFNRGFSIGTSARTGRQYVVCEQCAQHADGPVTGGLSGMFTTT